MAKGNSLDRFIRSASEDIPRTHVPSSLLSVNEILDNPNGLQSGRMGDIVGGFSTGKTTLALDFIRNAQQVGIPCAYADVERTFDKRYAVKCGVNINDLQLIYADTAENNLAVVEHMARNGTKLIVIDSVTALIPAAHMDHTPDESTIDLEYYEKNKKVAALGSLLGDWSKRMVPIIDYHNVTILFINQYRSNFSTMSRSDKKPYGPWQYSYNLTWRIELARVENAESETTVEAKCTKNKLGVERRVCRYGIIYGEGLNVKGDLLAHAIRGGMVQKSGAWFYYRKDTPHEIKAQGEKQALDKFPFDTIRQTLLTGELT